MTSIWVIISGLYVYKHKGALSHCNIFYLTTITFFDCVLQFDQAHTNVEVV